MLRLLRPKLLYLMFIVIMANNGFNLFPWFNERNSICAADIGLILVVISLPFVLILNRNINDYTNVFSLLIFFYLFMVLIDVPLCSMYYNQSFIDGVIAVRHQFYYLFFFVCLSVLTDLESIKDFFELLTVVTVILSILSLIHHFYPFIFHGNLHYGLVRGGFRRIFVPAMWLVCFSTFWVYCKILLSEENVNILNIATIILFISILLFRQTRSLILGFLLIAGALAFIRKKMLFLVGAIFILFVFFIIVQTYVGGNIVVSLGETTVNDLSKGEGTWATRMGQAIYAYEKVLEKPFFGTGSIAIRMMVDEARSSKEYNMASLAYKADLGYVSWLKAYGLIGVGWLVVLYFAVFKKIRKMMGYQMTYPEIYFFVFSFCLFIAFTFVTINYFMYPMGIGLIALLMVSIIRLDNVQRNSLGC